MNHKISYALAAVPMLLMDVAITAASGAAHLAGAPLAWSRRPGTPVPEAEVE